MSKIEQHEIPGRLIPGWPFRADNEWTDFPPLWLSTSRPRSGHPGLAYIPNFITEQEEDYLIKKVHPFPPLDSSA